MSYITIAAQGSATITLTAGQKIAVKTQGEAQVFQLVGFPNYPEQLDLLATVTSGGYTSSAFANGATIVVNAGAFPVLYDLGTDATVGDGRGAVGFVAAFAGCQGPEFAMGGDVDGDERGAEFAVSRAAAAGGVEAAVGDGDGGHASAESFEFPCERGPVLGPFAEEAGVF